MKMSQWWFALRNSINFLLSTLFLIANYVVKNIKRSVLLTTFATSQAYGRESRLRYKACKYTNIQKKINLCSKVVSNQTLNWCPYTCIFKPFFFYSCAYKKVCSTWVKTMFVLVDEHRSIIRSMYLFRRSLSIPLT